MPKTILKTQSEEAKRPPLQPKSGNKRSRPHDMQDHQGPKKAARKSSDLETLSDLVTQTETAIYSRSQVKRMPRKKLENAYLSLQDSSAETTLPPADKQKLENYETGEQVPEVVVGICNNYIEITVQLLKMTEKVEEEKLQLQRERDWFEDRLREALRENEELKQRQSTTQQNRGIKRPLGALDDDEPRPTPT